tara:strand:- start:443 stop:1057 length:615 start_codon:yes stop_codon:yes gene_type:complete
MKVLIACEFSGRVRQAFRQCGHDAWSCDLLPSDDNSKHHIIGDVENILKDNWDLLIAHPPCTYLTNSGVVWLHRDPNRWNKLDEAAQFFKKLLNANISKKCIENPIMHKYAIERIGGVKQTQIIQPWMFGHTEQKATCLWLANLPDLKSTDNVKKEMLLLPDNERQRLHYLPPSKDRWKLRSMTYQGIANAMAEQWGKGIGEKK